MPIKKLYYDDTKTNPTDAFNVTSIMETMFANTTANVITIKLSDDTVNVTTVRVDVVPIEEDIRLNLTSDFSIESPPNMLVGQLEFLIPWFNNETKVKIEADYPYRFDNRTNRLYALEPGIEMYRNKTTFAISIVVSSDEIIYTVNIFLKNLILIEFLKQFKFGC